MTSLNCNSSSVGVTTPTPTGLLSLLQVDRQKCTQAILEAKKRMGTSWELIAAAVERSPVWVTSCCLGENSMDVESARKLVSFLGLGSEDVVKALCAPVPLKGQTEMTALLQDPTIYRLHEINVVYGLTIKELIQEKFGDGIMSAIDFKMELEREKDPPNPDRVKIIMSGKFLPYNKW